MKSTADAGCPLGDGKIEGFSVVCPWHPWKYDVTTDNCLSVGGSSVRRYEIAVAGDDLYVRVSRPPGYS